MNITANGNTDIGVSDGYIDFRVNGTFDSATVKLQTLGADGTTWIDVADASFTADGQTTIMMSEGSLRVNVAGGGASLDIHVSADQIRIR